MSLPLSFSFATQGDRIQILFQWITPKERNVGQRHLVDRRSNYEKSHFLLSEGDALLFL